MKKLCFLCLACLILSSHDMFLKMDSFFLEPNTPSTIQLFNGTFEKSDNIITRDRMQDASLVGLGERTSIDTASWSDADKTTILNFTTGNAGTWVAGVSTKARNIELAAKDFNDYLVHDGVMDMLDFRKENDLLEKDAVEKYSKHVKTIFQIGEERSDDWKTILGYPIEFVPISNPYEVKQGDEIEIKLLWKGEALKNQLVYAGNEHDEDGHSHDESGGHKHSNEEDHDHGHSHTNKPMRTNDNGIVKLELNNSGHWYLRTIMMELSEEEGLTHESNWATLTFEVAKDPKMAENGHYHEDGSFHTHDHDAGILKYILFGIAGLGLLFFIYSLMKRKSDV